jgi:hypothetical protein
MGVFIWALLYFIISLIIGYIVNDGPLTIRFFTNKIIAALLLSIEISLLMQPANPLRKNKIS